MDCDLLLHIIKLSKMKSLGHLDAQTDAGRTSCEDKRRDRSDAPTSEGAPKIVTKLPAAGGAAQDKFSFRAPGRNRAHWHLNLRLPPQNCEIIHSVAGAIQFVGLCYSSPIKLIQWYHTHGANKPTSPISCLRSSLVKESQPVTGFCVIWNIAYIPSLLCSWLGQ